MRNLSIEHDEGKPGRYVVVDSDTNKDVVEIIYRELPPRHPDFGDSDMVRLFIENPDE